MMIMRCCKVVQISYYNQIMYKIQNQIFCVEYSHSHPYAKMWRKCTIKMYKQYYNFRFMVIEKGSNDLIQILRDVMNFSLRNSFEKCPFF
jgi:hypothetical protein